jgi:hypothetical protein
MLVHPTILNKHYWTLKSTHRQKNSNSGRLQYLTHNNNETKSDKKKSQQRTLRTDTAYLTAPVQYTLILIDCNGMKLEINDERNYIKHSKHMETEYIA